MKNISIELIGVSGSGKSYTEEEIRNNTKIIEKYITEEKSF